jgi:hypothetical protein
MFCLITLGRMSSCHFLQTRKYSSACIHFLRKLCSYMYFTKRLNAPDMCHVFIWLIFWSECVHVPWSCRCSMAIRVDTKLFFYFSLSLSLCNTTNLSVVDAILGKLFVTLSPYGSQNSPFLKHQHFPLFITFAQSSSGPFFIPSSVNI